MSRIGIDSFESTKKHAKHLRAVADKRDVLYRKELLLQCWEGQDRFYDHKYILGLRARIRALRNQLEAMRPTSMDEFERGEL